MADPLKTCALRDDLNVCHCCADNKWSARGRFPNVKIPDKDLTALVETF